MENEENFIAADEPNPEEDYGYVKMDFSLETPEERVKKVEEIISKTPPERLTQNYLTKLSDYIIFAMDKKEKQEKKIITENHMSTVKDREISFEGLMNHFENNENTGDVIYNMITNDKNIIFRPKINKITDEEIAEIPGLKQLREDIEILEKQFKAARGKHKYNIKSQIISMQKDQYVIRSAYKPTSVVNSTNAIKSFKKLDFSEKITLNEKGEVESTGFINFYNQSHVSAILCNYEKLVQENWANCMSDAKWMLVDFENLVADTFKDNPVLKDITYYKIYGYTNAEIQKVLADKHNTSYSVEYLSYLWRNKIPKMIVDTAEEQWILWHFTEEEPGYWKTCTKCGKTKLGINRFFSKNSASKDGLYSICKECRNKKTKENKIKYMNAEGGDR